ncbi:Nitrogen assimilation transcription factor nit-4 [Lachnellula suecica]|uniref:Nitrogen assimilation transcription factor nit-4 n=1 Tax=Lachnellula suecica TaxID=602035 RepID=A0A8T9C2G6_9HELO|nr:Nitrogen assimilation transcription factor nit-4 [Lachnellula suecica]
MADSSSNSKRRRGLGIVTPNACTECRKKRAKCDGQVPCGRCASQKGIDCVYEMPVRQSKENMRSEIEQLREQQRQSDRVIAALVSKDRSEDVLTQLRDGVTVETITGQLERLGSTSSTSGGSNVTSFGRMSDHHAIRSALRSARNIRGSSSSTLGLRDIQGLDLQSQGQHTGSTWPAWSSEGQVQNFTDGSQDGSMSWSPDTVPFSPQSGLTLPLIGSWHQTAAGQSPPDSSIQFARGEGQGTLLGKDFGLDGRPESADAPFNGTWTTVTSDSALVEHLMALYFCWEYPTFASLNKEHFLEDFKNGRRRFCSPLLVNSILALGCRFSEQPNTRTDPRNSHTAGEHFFAEASRLLEVEVDRHILTTVQALGLMSIREASSGRSSRSLFLAGQSIRLAMEMGLHFEPEHEGSTDAQMEHAVRSATFWGAFSLDQAWSLSIGRLPHFSRDTKLVTKPAIIDEVEASEWVPYTDDGAPFARSCTQPSNIRSVYKTFCELSEIVHNSLYAFYTPGSNVTGKKVVDLYTQYLNWYDSIPTALRLGENFTPAVLFAHMYYHFAILLLFRPFIKLDIVGSKISPRDVCSQAADAISTLVHSYSQLYSLRRTPSFVPYFVLTSGITHVVTLGASRGGPENLHQGVQYLREMQSCHEFANRAVDILHYFIRDWEVEYTLDFQEDEGKGKQDYKALCPSSSTSLNQFCPNIGSVASVHGIGPVAPDENPLFWPFPLQGKPLLDLDSNLEAAGFEILL